MDASHLAGYSRIGLFLGVLVAAVGVYAALEPVGWLGVGVVALAFAGNLLAKVRHYQAVEMTPAARTRIVATWGALALTTVVMVAFGVAVQFGAPYDRYFWVSAGVALVLLVAHRVVRGASLPASARESDGEE